MTRSKRIRTNTWRRLRRDLCPGGKDDDCTDRDCASRGERVAPPPNGCKEHLSSRRIRRGGVHGTTTRLQLEHPSKSGMPTQEAPLRPKARTALSRYYARAWRNEAGPRGSWTEEQVIDGEMRERERAAYV